MQENAKLRRSAVTYSVLCACLLAAGIGAYIAARDAVPQPGAQTTRPTAASTAYTPAEAPVRDIPVTEPIPQTQTEAAEESAPQAKYVYPLGTLVVKDYSGGHVVYSETMEDWRVHSGVDFGDNRGQSVLAIADGTVLDVRDDPLWGVVVTIDHGEEVVATYCGIEKDSAPAVQTKVEKGAVIGRLGEIPVEAKDGPHLHFEVTVRGAQADPLEVLR